ncbi:MAG: GIY-YIG nuclease family protein [Nitrospinae bacterium]|nr:GIY-YIG nuclease family protein [Nitrospinota bacterium]
MLMPFSITLFATTGDPEGIRLVEKSNWSGSGVVFPKEQFDSLKNQPGFDEAGIYLLIGNAAEETIYIGEADPVGQRLKNHVTNREGWEWGVYFFDTLNKIGKTEVQYLESELVAQARRCNRSIVLNKNNPTMPTMSSVAKATVQAFLRDVLLILPLLGINAFTEKPLTEEIAEDALAAGIENRDGENFDTVIVPAREEGFQKTFLGENCWYAIRINARHIPKLKHIAAYRVAPIGAITHLAEIGEITPYENTGKYLIKFKGAAASIGPIHRSENSSVNLQSPRYALREKIANARDIDHIWPTEK